MIYATLKKKSHHDLRKLVRTMSIAPNKNYNSPLIITFFIQVEIKIVIGNLTKTTTTRETSQ